MSETSTKSERYIIEYFFSINETTAANIKKLLCIVKLRRVFTEVLHYEMAMFMWQYALAGSHRPMMKSHLSQTRKGFSASQESSAEHALFTVVQNSLSYPHISF